MTRSLTIALSIAVLSTLVAPPAQADMRVTVHDFYGPNANRVRDDVVNLLERQSGVTIISKGQIEATAEKLGVDPYSPEGRRALGRELQLAAWMTGVVKKSSGQLKLTIAVFDGDQHALIAKTRLSGGSVSKLATAIKTRLWRRSRYAIMSASSLRPAAAPGTNLAANAPPAPAAAGDGETADAPEAAATLNFAEAPAPDSGGAVEQLPEAGGSSNVDDDEPGEDLARNERKGESLRAFLGFGSPYRNLAYTTPITSGLGDFQLSGAPMLDLNLAFHPARPFTDGVASWFGVDVRAQISLSNPTFDRGGNQFQSRYDAYHVGLRARVPFGPHYVSAFSGYAMSRFDISSKSDAVNTPTPSVDYRMVRSGAGVELALSDTFMVGVEGALLQYLSVGDIGRWFPRATAGGFELAASATYSVTAGVFARLSAAYQRTTFDFNTSAGDKYAAQGATDQFLAMSVGAGFRL